MKALFPPSANRVLREDVAEALREVIIGGGLKPGDRIIESAIAEQMGISRAPVREAIRQLEQEGLIETTPRRGTVVTRLSQDGIWEIYSLRSVLEGFAARLAAHNHTPEDIAHLESLLQAMVPVAEAGDVAELVRLDLAFHSYICKIARHARLYQLDASLIRQIRVLYHVTDLPAFIRASYRDLKDYPHGHGTLIEAIRAGQGAEAEEIARRHVADAGHRLAEMLCSKEAASSLQTTNWDVLRLAGDPSSRTGTVHASD